MIGRVLGMLLLVAVLAVCVVARMAWHARRRRRAAAAARRVQRFCARCDGFIRTPLPSPPAEPWASALARNGLDPAVLRGLCDWCCGVLLTRAGFGSTETVVAGRYNYLSEAERASGDGSM